MRVVFINAVCGSGSTGRIVTGLMDSLKEKGVESLAFYGRGKAPQGYMAYRIGTDFDVCMHGAISRITDRHGLYSSKATKRILSLIKEYSPDIIHIHNIHGYYINYEILFNFLKKEYGGRIVWTLHDCWTFTGHCSHFSYIGCEKWKNGCGNCPQLKEYPKSLLMDASKSNLSLKKALFTRIKNMELVTPSDWLKNVVLKSFMGEYPIQTVPTGIDLNAFKFRSSDLREKYKIGKKPLILGVANPWRERKGYNDFITLANIMGSEYAFAMVGLRHKEMRNLPSNIIGIARTDSLSEMVEWYSTSDIYVNLTKEDTFPTANLEAMAVGTPVITYDTGGSPESLGEGTGKVVPVGDIEGVVKAIGEILAMDRESLHKDCRRRAEDYSAKKRFAEYIERVYRL